MLDKDFTNVQLIAYEIATDKPFEIVKNQPRSQDIVMRAQHLYTVMTTILNTFNLDASALKIFVVPEFYFRSFSGKPDGTGHYDNEDILLGIRALKQVCRKNVQLNDWLIVAGTSIHTESYGYGYQSKRVVFAQLHIFTGGKGIDLTLNKQNFSDIDNLDNKLNGSATQIISEAESLIQGPFFLGATATDYKPVQIAKNIKVGFEICLDHAEQRLRIYATASSTPAEDKIIDVHVLTACGRSAIDTAVTTKNLGYFFRCDGHSHPDNFGSQSIQAQWRDPKATALTQTDRVYLTGKSKVLHRAELPEDDLPIDETHKGDPGHPLRAITIYESEPIVVV